MTNYLWIIFEVNVVINLLFCVFKLTQRFLSFGWQRFSLLSIPLLSILAVWMKQETVSKSSWSYHIPVFELETVEISSKKYIAPSNFDYSTLLEVGYWIGVLLLSAWTIFSICKVLQVFLRAKKTKKEGFTLIELPNEAPSSFFRFIQLPAGLSEYDREIIFEHEKIHAQKLHSADRLLLETAHCLSWFNPVFLLMKKELIHIHEFEVDRIMYTKYRVGYMEFLLAYSLGTSSSIYSFTNQFMTKLTLIKRIKIMKKNSKKVLIAALALPIFAGGLTLISFTTVSDQGPQKRTENRLSDVKSKSQQIAAPEKASKATNVPKESTSVPQEKMIQFIPPIGTDEISTSEAPNSTTLQKENKAAEYPGGMEEMTKYMIANIKYPETAVKAKTTGKVYVSFVVTKDGKVTKATVKKGVSKELNNEALRVISTMPNWIPAQTDGEKVDAEMVLPVSFML